MSPLLSSSSWHLLPFEAFLEDLSLRAVSPWSPQWSLVHPLNSSSVCLHPTTTPTTNDISHAKHQEGINCQSKGFHSLLTKDDLPVLTLIFLPTTLYFPGFLSKCLTNSPLLYRFVFILSTLKILLFLLILSWPFSLWHYQYYSIYLHGLNYLPYTMIFWAIRKRKGIRVNIRSPRNVNMLFVMMDLGLNLLGIPLHPTTLYLYHQNERFRFFKFLTSLSFISVHWGTELLINITEKVKIRRVKVTKSSACSKFSVCLH